MIQKISATYSAHKVSGTIADQTRTAVQRRMGNRFSFIVFNMCRRKTTGRTAKLFRYESNIDNQRTVFTSRRG